MPRETRTQDLQEQISGHLKDIHELLMAQPTSEQARLSDAMIRWALTQFLASSTYFGGLMAYSGIGYDGKPVVPIRRVRVEPWVPPTALLRIGNLDQALGLTVIDETEEHQT